MVCALDDSDTPLKQSLRFVGQLKLNPFESRGGALVYCDPLAYLTEWLKVKVNRHTNVDMGGGPQPGGQVVHVDDRACDFWGVFPDLLIETLGAPKAHNVVPRIGLR